MVLSGRIRNSAPNAGELSRRREHQFTDTLPIVAVDALHVLGQECECIEISGCA